MRYGVLPLLLLGLVGCSMRTHAVTEHAPSASPSAHARIVRFHNGVELTLPAGVCVTAQAQADFDLLEFRSESTILAGAYVGTAGTFPSEECAAGHPTKGPLPSEESFLVIREEIAGPRCREIALRTIERDGSSWSGVLFHVWPKGSGGSSDQRFEDLIRGIRVSTPRTDDIIPADARCRPAA
jgi:hypothetical protein